MRKAEQAKRNQCALTSRHGARRIVEMLETRRMFAVVYDPATDRLSLNGTNGADAYGVTYVAATAATGATVRVTEGLAVFNFPVATKPIVRINATLRDGADSLAVQATLNIPLNATGDAGNDTISGGSAADTINGGNDRDLLTGNAGNDTINGGDHQDTINGNDGKDTLNGYWGEDFIHGHKGDDSILGDIGHDTLYGDEGKDTISGGEDSNDRIYGGTENDSIHGNGGNDTVNGDSGNDTIFGDNDLDSLSGDTGDDSILGGNQNDTLNGNDGKDTLDGGANNDFLDGGKGNDSLLGSSGNDSMWGREDADTLKGSDGIDTMRGEAGNDSVVGGSGNDDLDGGGSADTLNGEGGTDTVKGGSANDLVRGGSGNDLVYGGEGDDSVYGGAGTDTLFGDGGRDGLFGGADALEDSVYGGAGNDRFLNKYTGGSVIGQNWEDDLRDKSGDEARIGFKNGKAETGLTFAGQAGTYDYAAGTWTDSEIETIDGSLDILHDATGNKELLEKKGGNEIEMLRHGPQTAAVGGTFNAAAWNDGGQVHVVTVSIETLLHEIGHYWDTEYDKNGWRDISGWEKNPADTTGMTQALDASGDWWFNSSAVFVSTYATTTPEEDFSESFANYFMNLGGLTFAGDAGGQDISTISAKETFFDDMVTDLS